VNKTRLENANVLVEGNFNKAVSIDVFDVDVAAVINGQSCKFHAGGLGGDDALTQFSVNIPWRFTSATGNWSAMIH